MKVRRLAGPAVALALSLAAAPAALAKADVGARAPHPTRYYVALGDSLSVGYQPGPYGGTPTGETNRGYSNDLAAMEGRRIKHLRLVEMGCPGDTVESMLTGKGNEKNARANHCDRRHGSQLKAAVAFLRAHHRKGEVPLVTVDIGANDVDGCASAGSLAAIGACVTKGENAIRTDTPKILNALRKAAPRGTTLAAMNLYDPVLGYYLSADPNQKTLAEASIPLLKGINSDIDKANKAAGFKDVDVADAFRTYDQAPYPTPYEGQAIPTDVAYVCAWTWACTTPPVGPNIHANDLGYWIIARTFYRAIGRLK